MTRVSDKAEMATKQYRPSSLGSNKKILKQVGSRGMFSLGMKSEVSEGLRNEYRHTFKLDSLC